MHVNLQEPQPTREEVCGIGSEIRVAAENSSGERDLVSNEARKTSCDQLYAEIPPKLRNSDLACLLVSEHDETLIRSCIPKYSALDGTIQMDTFCFTNV